ncbi:MAG: hypothetical protein A2Y40_03280 [Candidatus Margulisbacteria bacterium GWF2_35_9]|nr:MAG: hypothetical protein A2Y40_03280 [Candidatus Margulisbacteria bacterium GWF2_35_9]
MQEFACLGPAGTYSHKAAIAYFKAKSIKKDVAFFPTIIDVLESVENKKVMEAIVPVENSVEGTVNETQDFLARCKHINIIAEITIDIDHNIIGFLGADLKKVTKVISHPQPIAQCKTFIRKNMPNASVEYSTSTTAAIQKVAELGDNKNVAIGNSLIVKDFGLEILKRNISDTIDNQTRFFVINNDKTLAKGDKVSIVFSIEKDVPGGLYRILGEFANRGINLTKIESRPSKGDRFTYKFFIDLQGCIADNEVKKALDNISKLSTFFKILGVYEEIGSC